MEPSQLSNHHHAGPSRRELLAGFTAVTAGTLLTGGRSAAQNGAANPRRIDVHHHFTPAEYVAFEKTHSKGNNAPWTLEKDLEDMDKNGTATAILSVTTPGFLFGEREEIRKVMRQC